MRALAAATSTARPAAPRKTTSSCARRCTAASSPGGLAGHVYGAEGIWGADIEDQAPIKMWDAFQWNSAAQMQHLRTFAFSIGKRYQELVPDADLVSPEQDARPAVVRGLGLLRPHAGQEHLPARISRRAVRAARSAAPGSNSLYRAEWFDPRTGTWQDAGDGTLRSSVIGIIMLPDFPGDIDWGLRLMSISARP